MRRLLLNGVVAGALIGALTACASLLGADFDRHERGPEADGDSGAPASSGGHVPALPITCSAPQVPCIAGCCDDNPDPGLPIAIAAGYANSCAVTTTGKVRCWGSNFAGQLGRGEGKNSPVPLTAYNIPSGATAVAI